MNILLKIFSSILTVLILVPVLGINFNTHICGQTNDVSKSIVVPGIINSEECDKCHIVVVVKTCCNNKDTIPEEGSDNQSEDKECCQDILEYSSFDFLTVTPYVQNLVSYTSAILSVNFQEVFNNTRTSDKILDFGKRLRPSQPDIISLKCSYLI